MTVDEAAIADAQDAQPADSTGEDGDGDQPAPSEEGQPAPSGEGQAQGSGQAPSSEIPPTATDADPSSEAGEKDTGVLAADEPA